MTQGVEESGEGTDPIRKGRSDAASLRESEERQEIWCEGSDANWGCWVIGMVVVVGMLAGMAFLVVNTLVKNQWGVVWAGDFETLGLTAEIFALAGVLVVMAVVAVVACMWSAFLACVNRTVVRLEPGRVKVIKRPLGWGAMFEVEVGEIKGVRIGKNVRRGESGVERTVVLELGGGRYAWLLQSRGVGEAESVAWEVADYYGVPCMTAASEGALVGRAWMPMNGNEPMLEGVEAWDEARVLEAGVRGWVMEVDGGRVTLTKPMMPSKGWYLGRIGACAAVAGLVLGMFKLGGLWMVGGVGLAICAGVPGVLIAFGASLTELVETRVRISGAGVYERTRILWWMFASQNHGGGGARVAITMPRGMDSDWRNAELGRFINWSRKLETKMPFWIVTERAGAPGWQGVIGMVSGEAGYALGLRALFERALKAEAFEEVEEVEEEEKREKVVDAQGRVMMMDWWVFGWWMIGIGLAMVVFAVLASWDLVPRAAERLDFGLLVVIMGVASLIALWGALILPGRRWMEVSEGKLKVRSCGWGGETTREAFEAAEIERAWVQIKHRGMARPGVNGSALMLRFKGEDSRSVEVKMARDILTKEELARGINQLLGVEGETEIAVGLVINGVFVKVSEENEVVLPEALPAGWVADAGGKRSYTMRRENGRVEMARTLVRVGVGDMLGYAGLLLFAGFFSAMWQWGNVAADRKLGLVLMCVLLGGIVLKITAWLMKREWVSVQQGKIQMQALSLTGIRARALWIEDVQGLKVLCEGSLLGGKVEFSVVAQGREEEQVMVATKIRHAEEAIAMRDAIGEVMKEEREAVKTRESREWEKREKVGRFLGKR